MTVADSEFPGREGGVCQPPRWGAGLLFDQKFPENCMNPKLVWIRRWDPATVHQQDRNREQ